MMDKLLDEILEREGSKDTDDPLDNGGRTKFGVSQKFHPEMWLNGPPTREAAKTLFLTQYIILPKIHLITPDYLSGQVADFAVHSGPIPAVKALQRVLLVEEDGVIGPRTLTALSNRNPDTVNTQLVVERSLMFDRIVQKRPSDLKWLFGWHVRAFKFMRF